MRPDFAKLKNFATLPNFLTLAILFRVYLVFGTIFNLLRRFVMLLSNLFAANGKRLKFLWRNFEYINWSHSTRWDQIGWFLKSFADIFYYESSQNLLWLLGYSWNNHTLEKTTMVLLGNFLEKLGLFFISTSGRTGHTQTLRFLLTAEFWR